MTRKLSGLVLLLLLSTCSHPEGNTEAVEPAFSRATKNPSKDYFAEKATVTYAQHFTVTYHDHYKIVRTNATLYPDGKETAGEDQSDVLVLVQKGTPAPALEGPLAGATMIPIPAEDVAVNVEYSESFLRELGLVDHITAIGGLYSYDEQMRNKARNQEVGQIGYSWHSPPNLEVLLERQPGLFLMTLASLAHTESLDKCRQLGIPTAAVFDWAEQDYLARAEWIKFYALFFNAEGRANQVFAQISNRIEELRAVTAQQPQESALWAYYTGNGQWATQITSFPAQYMRDAHLKNVLLGKVKPDANGKQVLDTEQLLLHGQDATHWIIGDIHASPLPKETLMSSFQAWNTEKLYHNMGRVDHRSNTSDWYATAIVRPDSVLADLIKLAHPTLLSDYQPVFMGMYNKEKPLN